MNFEVLHQVITYVLIGIGMLSISLSGELPIWITVLATVGIALTWFIKAPPMEKTPLWWFGILLAIFAGLIGLAAQTGEWLESTVAFAVVMVISKLFQRHVARDFYQLYTLSFLLIVGGAVMNPGVSFASMFLLYIIALTLGLVVLHLRRDLEERQEAREEMGQHGESSEPAYWKVRDLVTRRFLVGTAVLALAVFAASIVIFFAFPRVGFGFFLSRSRPGPSVAGFSSQVELGHFGTIKDDATVVARVELPETDGPLGEPLRLRGISFDTYNGKRWSREKGARGRKPLRGGRGGVRMVERPDPLPAGTSRLRQRIYLEPLRSDIRPIFGQSAVTEFQFDDSIFKTLSGTKRRFFQSLPSEDLSFEGPERTSIIYEVVSEILPIRPIGIEQAGEEYPEGIRNVYLQLPSDLNPGIGELAETLAGAESHPFAKAKAIETHLSTKFEYTLTSAQGMEDPLADFLLKTRAGHCEYFASGMVVLLRTLGIPARMANGFYGGAWNEFGQYYAIRQGDAHAWVEAYFPGYGWLTFEPTPPAGTLVPPSNDWGASLQSYLDSMKLQWFKWVIEYDLEKQIAVFRELGKKLGGLGGRGEGEFGDRTEQVKDWLEDSVSQKKIGWTILLLIGCIFGVLLLVVGVRNLRGGGDSDRRKAREAWRQWRRWMGYAGEPQSLSATPEELVAEMQQAGWRAWRDAEKLARAIQDVSFGGQSWSGVNEEVSANALAAIRAEAGERRDERKRRAA